MLISYLHKKLFRSIIYSLTNHILWGRHLESCLERQGWVWWSLADRLGLQGVEHLSSRRYCPSWDLARMSTRCAPDTCTRSPLSTTWRSIVHEQVGDKINAWPLAIIPVIIRAVKWHIQGIKIVINPNNYVYLVHKNYSDSKDKDVYTLQGRLLIMLCTAPGVLICMVN